MHDPSYFFDFSRMRNNNRSDPRDIEASSEACEHLAILAQEQRIWRELAQYHFTPQQIASTRQHNPGKDWKTIFTIARR